MSAYPTSMNIRGIRDTIIEDTPQVSSRRAPPQPLKPRPAVCRTEDDIPTPRACVPQHLRTVESIADSYDGSVCSSSSTRSDSGNAFDEMYDLSSSESEEFPITLSRSVKKRVNTSLPKSLPSPAIPHLSHQLNLIKAKSPVTHLSPPLKVEVTPTTLAALQRRHLSLSASSSAPSLDGSMTSDELAALSCPPTPDTDNTSDHEDAWEAPIQLDPSAIALLHEIHQLEDFQASETVIEVPEDAATEMREIMSSPGLVLSLKTDSGSLGSVGEADPEDQLSALSIPTPGGFFSSLNSLARHTWTGAEPTPNTSVASEFYGVPFLSPRTSSLPTSTATSFYGVPWTERPSNPIEHTVSVATPISDAPATARRVAFSPSETVVEVHEIDETYDSQLKEKAEANVDRTEMWLSMQNDYMNSLRAEEYDVTNSFQGVEDATPKTPEQPSASHTGSSPSDKHGSPLASERDQKSGRRISPIHDGTFWEGWRHQKRSARARDVFQHRQARAEAEHVRRISCKAQHSAQLQGRFDIGEADAPRTSTPTILASPTAAEEEKRQRIVRAERERRALDQLRPSAWHVQAQKELNGGQLLTSPNVGSFKGRKGVKILDLAGQASCGWAWNVAIDHPAATVYTTVATDAESNVNESSLDGPANHKVVAAPCLWKLPFDKDTFDVVSARNLYTQLRLHKPEGQTGDEWDLTLQECQRILKPGGFLEFDLLDAELAHAEAAAQALSVEFAFNLKTRGYDVCAGKSFLPRLKRAGFDSIKRAWMVLPVADVVPPFTDIREVACSNSAEKAAVGDGNAKGSHPTLIGSTRNVRAITGLVGARNWEQWILKLNGEMGKNESRCLEGVAQALEEGGKGKAAWKSLVGWARKEI